MLKNDIEMDVKMRCIEKSATQAEIAENKDLGFDVELHYVEREDDGKEKM